MLCKNEKAVIAGGAPFSKWCFFVLKSDWLALRSNVSLDQGYKIFFIKSRNHFKILGAKMVM